MVLIHADGKMQKAFGGAVWCLRGAQLCAKQQGCYHQVGSHKRQLCPKLTELKRSFVFEAQNLL